MSEHEPTPGEWRERVEESEQALRAALDAYVENVEYCAVAEALGDTHGSSSYFTDTPAGLCLHIGLWEFSAERSFSLDAAVNSEIELFREDQGDDRGRARAIGEKLIALGQRLLAGIEDSGA